MGPFSLTSFSVTSFSASAKCGLLFGQQRKKVNNLIRHLRRDCRDGNWNQHHPTWCVWNAGLAKTSRRTFFRACVFTIFLPHLWNGFIFFCGIYNVFLVPCIVLVSEMLSFTMVTKLNDILIWKLHRFVLYEVVSKASRGSLLQLWFIRFLVYFQSNVFRKRVFIECQ